MCITLRFGEEWRRSVFQVGPAPFNYNGDAILAVPMWEKNRPLISLGKIGGIHLTWPIEVNNAINVIRIMWLEGVLGTGIKNGATFSRFCSLLFHISQNILLDSFHLGNVKKYKVQKLVDDKDGRKLQHNLALVASLAGKAAMRISMIKPTK